jgi:uncharacterized RDD family membrane protein YckC
MSTDQPGDDPFRKKPQPGEPQPGQSPYGGPSSDPYGGTAASSDPLAGMPPLGSRGKRLLARIVDALLIGIPIAVIAGLVTGFDSYDDTSAQYWQGGLYTLVYFVYEGVLLSRSGQTVGKKLMKIRVAMLQNGAAPSGAPAWVRALIYQIPALIPCLGFLFWLINVLFCTWDKPYQQCIHDKGAKTVVVRAD